jgi:hypothetical protein
VEVGYEGVGFMLVPLPYSLKRTALPRRIQKGVRVFALPF